MGTAAYFACCACEAELKKSFSGKKIEKGLQEGERKIDLYKYINFGHM